MKTTMTLILAVLLSLGFAVTSFATIVGSPHDLTFTRTDVVTQNTEVCIYCHTPHQAKVEPTDYNPLWNMGVTAVVYTSYTGGTQNTTFQGGTISDPLIGPSRLCMSCHDGTIAIDSALATSVGDIYINSGKEIGTVLTATTGSLNSDHPIGFDYTAVAAVDAGIEDEGELIGATTILSNLFNDTIMTCATCHDVHERGGAGGMFLLTSNAGSLLCLSCHIK